MPFLQTPRGTPHLTAATEVIPDVLPAVLMDVIR